MSKKINLLLLGSLFPIVVLGQNSVIGNGSIMASYENVVSDSNHQGPYPFGVTQDMTILQTISNKNVGFFQWFINSNSCDKLKMYLYHLLGESVQIRKEDKANIDGYIDIGLLKK